MAKAIFISVKSTYGKLILTKEKLIEVRKSIPKDFTGPVYIYITKAKPYLNYVDGKYILSKYRQNEVNGKVVARFWYDEHSIYPYGEFPYPSGYEDFDGNWVDTTEKVDESYGISVGELKRTCLEYEDLEEYGNKRTLYGWHIKNLEIFETPQKLDRFMTMSNEEAGARNLAYLSGKWSYLHTLKIPPQSWRYVYMLDNMEVEYYGNNESRQS